MAEFIGEPNGSGRRFAVVGSLGLVSLAQNNLVLTEHEGGATHKCLPRACPEDPGCGGVGVEGGRLRCGRVACVAIRADVALGPGHKAQNDSGGCGGHRVYSFDCRAR